MCNRCATTPKMTSSPTSEYYEGTPFPSADNDDITSTSSSINGKQYNLSPSEHESGIEHKHILNDKNGQRYMLKIMRSSSAQAEVYVALLARAAGLRSQVADKVDSMSSPFCGVCESGEGVLVTMNANARKSRFVDTTANAIEVIKLALIDYIVDNGDRHDGNVMSDDGHVYVIDNGHCFRGNDVAITDTMRWVQWGWTSGLDDDTIRQCVKDVRIAVASTWNDATYDQREIMDNKMYSLLRAVRSAFNVDIFDMVR